MNSFLIPADETPEQAALRKRQAVAQALMPQSMPQNVGQGINALGQAIALRAQRQNEQFPTAPGGAKPSLMTTMANLFSGGNNGGLY